MGLVKFSQNFEVLERLGNEVIKNWRWSHEKVRFTGFKERFNVKILRNVF